jgi:LemA protein
MADVFGMIVAICTICVAAVWFAFAYNLLVRDLNRSREAWSGIDVQLKLRHDLLPNLVEVVSAYAKHERDVLEGVTSARTAALAETEPAALARQENRLTERLRSLFALAESYPELLADRSFANLHDQLVIIEDQLQMARRYYNGTVRDYNIRTESFPSNLVARIHGFESREFFLLASATERATPAVDLTP